MISKIEKVGEPSQHGLHNMPKVVMEEVLKNLDCVSIFRLRKVCRNLRFSVDEINPELHFNSFTLELPLTTSSMESYTEKMDEGSKQLYVKLRKPRTGCSLKWKQGNVFKYAQISMEDAETLLKYPKLMVDNLTIVLLFSIENPSENIEKKEEDLKNFYEFLKALVEKRSNFLKTKKIRLDVRDLSQAADFLKCTDPQSLKTISIDCRPLETIELDFSKLESLEQWKNAEELKINGNFTLKSVNSFGTFKTISIYCEKISMEKLNEVKQLFARSPKLQKFRIESHNIKWMKDQILSSFGQFESYNEDEFDDPMFVEPEEFRSIRMWTWLEDIPGSIEQLLITLVWPVCSLSKMSAKCGELPEPIVECLTSSIVKHQFTITIDF